MGGDPGPPHRHSGAPPLPVPPQMRPAPCLQEDFIGGLGSPACSAPITPWGKAHLHVICISTTLWGPWGPAPPPHPRSSFPTGGGGALGGWRPRGRDLHTHTSPPWAPPAQSRARKVIRGDFSGMRMKRKTVRTSSVDTASTVKLLKTWWDPRRWVKLRCQWVKPRRWVKSRSHWLKPRHWLKSRWVKSKLWVKTLGHAKILA